MKSASLYATSASSKRPSPVFMFARNSRGAANSSSSDMARLRWMVMAISTCRIASSPNSRSPHFARRFPRRSSVCATQGWEGYCETMIATDLESIGWCECFPFFELPPSITASEDALRLFTTPRTLLPTPVTKVLRRSKAVIVSFPSPEPLLIRPAWELLGLFVASTFLGFATPFAAATAAAAVPSLPLFPAKHFFWNDKHSVVISNA
mmetsp:Transcript_13023/g.28121  ORF Transcript_13023/g.28121 Transcript_13023/m.28121 type:complete len:208 (+) Transcript_13023:311-934(+)